eukprot:SAG22_NODE_783_length_7251_cov_18.263423_3_plen_373_part_00
MDAETKHIITANNDAGRLGEARARLFSAVTAADGTVANFMAAFDNYKAENGNVAADDALVNALVSHKALPLPCVSTVFLSKTVPFRVVPLSQDTNLLGLAHLHKHEDIIKYLTSTHGFKTVRLLAADFDATVDDDDRIRAHVEEVIAMGDSWCEALQWLWVFAVSLCEMGSVSPTSDHACGFLREARRSSKKLAKLPWHTFDGESAADDRWDLLQALLLGYISFAVPYRIAFNAEPEVGSFFFIFELLVDIGFVLDVVKNFRTYYVARDGELVKDFARIRWHYLQGWMIIDIGSCFPVGYILLLQDDGATGKKESAFDFRLLKVLRLVQLTKMLRLGKLYKKVTAFNVAPLIQNGADSSFSFPPRTELNSHH